jgi:Ca-activated chloride channel family protein
VTSLLIVVGCNNTTSVNNNQNNPVNQGIEIKFLAGSDLREFCQQIATKLNATQPTLSNGENFYLTCDTKGSGDVLNEVRSLAQQLANGSIAADNPSFPTLIALDGEIYQNQLIYQIDQIFPGQNYIPPITDTPLIVFSPMVFMTTTELAPALEKTSDIYTAFARYNNYQQIDPQAQPLPIRFVQTAPIRSNSGLQTLVAQFASLTKKPPQDLTIEDITKHQAEVKAIQQKVTRYGVSTASLADAMVENGVFWASVGSVYESLVIQANSQPGAANKYRAVYPRATFSSNIRGILPNAPWISDLEREGGQKVLDFMLTPESQTLATELGLRPGIPGIPLGPKFTAQFGVNPNPNYESYRPPSPEVVDAMLKSWQDFAKKPSRVAVVIDVSGSMRGRKMTAVQNTLLNYVNNLGVREEIILIPFNHQILPSFTLNNPNQKSDAIAFISSLKADGGTALYDSIINGFDKLNSQYDSNLIQAVLVLTDGEDSGQGITFDQLKTKLQTQGNDQNIPIFTVGYGAEGEFNPTILTEIAQFSQGYFRQGNPDTIDELMRNLQLEF